MTEPLYTITKQDVELMITNMQNGDVKYGACTYNGPCVVGSGLPDDAIMALDNAGYNGTGIGLLYRRNEIAYASDVDHEYIERAQASFDIGNYDDVIPRLKMAIGEV